MTTYSKSRIDTFKKCPHQYNLHYNKEIRLEQSHSIDLEFGKWIHLVLEKYNPETDNRKEVVKFFRDFQIKDASYKAVMGSTLKNAIDFIKKYWKYQPRFTEETVEYSTDEYSIKGVIDLRMIQDDGNILIIDYKSSKNTSKSRHVYQMKMYCFMISNIYHIDPSKIKIMIYYPRIDQYDRYQFDKYDMDEFEQELKLDIKKIESATDFKKTSSFACRWCEYQYTKYCDA
jgi:ATP-dependent exoDNAse (exonuclease V) beta subunit